MNKNTIRLTSALAAVMGLGIMITPASAALCSNTANCTLHLTQSNGAFAPEDFGTVTLTLNNNVATVDVLLSDSGLNIIKTGFPGSVGFSDSLGGGLTIGNFQSGGAATAIYSGSLSDATSDLGFDGFGSFNNAVGTSGPHNNGSGLQELSFTVSKGSSLTDVNQLLNLANPAGGVGPAYFVVDVGQIGGASTGLIAVTGQAVPEPASYLALLLGGFGALGWVAKHRQSTSAA